MDTITRIQKKLYTEIGKNQTSLSVEEQHKLFLLYKKTGDRVYVNKIINSNLKLIAKQTQRFLKHHNPYDPFFLDFFGEAMLVATACIDKFDINKNASIVTWIKNNVLWHLYSFAKKTQFPVTINVFAINKIIEELKEADNFFNLNGREPQKGEEFKGFTFKGINTLLSSDTMKKEQETDYEPHKKFEEEQHALFYSDIIHSLVSKMDDEERRIVEAFLNSSCSFKDGHLHYLPRDEGEMRKIKKGRGVKVSVGTEETEIFSFHVIPPHFYPEKGECYTTKKTHEIFVPDSADFYTSAQYTEKEIEGGKMVNIKLKRVSSLMKKSIFQKKLNTILKEIRNKIDDANK
jgi:DNA-directed RNA polymerase specialized sigma subunit